MDDIISERTKAANALKYIIPLLEKYRFNWVITGGFACYAYGVNRMLTDIDIDIEASMDDRAFMQFMDDVKGFITQPLINYVDKSYNNYNFELTIDDQIIDICPMSELLIYDKKQMKYTNFYTEFPRIEIVEFEGFRLPLLTKELIIQNKLDLVDKDQWHLRDITELQKLLP